MNNSIEDDYSNRNRHKAKEAKYGWTWCHGCDRNIVSDIGKCGVCGTRLNPKKIKYAFKRSSFNS